MRASVLILIAAAVALVAAGDGESRIAAPRPIAQQVPAPSTVDVELVLAVDISYSMDTDELALQREGYAEAIVSPEFLRALKSGLHGRIVVTYVEWASAHDQTVVMPWRVVDGPESADRVAADIRAAPIRRASRTSISGAIAFAMPLFAESGERGARRVIDISGDGPNNNGMPVEIARNEAVKRGFVINGLPIMIKPVGASMMDIDKLDHYYEDCVIGGPGAFVVAATSRDSFKQAIRTKLIMEVAGRTPEAALVPAAAKTPRVDCMIGEQMWRRRIDAP